jgi:hypothetical protein
MSDKFQAFRKRLRVPKKEKSNWSSWIGSPTAWLALVISSTTAFFSLFYHSDELSVVANTGNVWLTAPDKVSPSAPNTFTFVNSGSRPIALLSAILGYAQPTREIARPECCTECWRGQIVNQRLRLEQTVVKPYDTMVRSIRHFLENRKMSNGGFH